MYFTCFNVIFAEDYKSALLTTYIYVYRQLAFGWKKLKIRITTHYSRLLTNVIDQDLSH